MSSLSGKWGIPRIPDERSDGSVRFIALGLPTASGHSKVRRDFDRAATGTRPGSLTGPFGQCVPNRARDDRSRVARRVGVKRSSRVLSRHGGERRATGRMSDDRNPSYSRPSSLVPSAGTSRLFVQDLYGLFLDDDYRNLPTFICILNALIAIEKIFPLTDFCWYAGKGRRAVRTS